jgi:GNAT superfamily N-acetyltransferase
MSVQKDITAEILFSIAEGADLDAIIALLTNDAIASQRESNDGDLSQYHNAFDEIQKDPNANIIIAKSDGSIIGCFQINFIANLTYKGGTRALVEGVRVDETIRGLGLGTRLIAKAIDMARERNCCLVQLTTDKQRPEALKFYEKLGFINSHHGLKLKL